MSLKGAALIGSATENLPARVVSFHLFRIFYQPYLHLRYGDFESKQSTRVQSN
jgi:hypothetical protein